MKTIFNFLLLSFMIALFISLNSCQMCTREFGGTTNITLEKNQEFLNVTWKGSDIWVLTRNKNTNDLEFIEYSTLGILGGKVIIKNPQKE